MNADLLRSLLLKCTVVTAAAGAGIIAYLAWSISVDLSDQNSSLGFRPFVAFYGAYLVFLWWALRRDFTPRRIHQYLSALFVPAGFVTFVSIVSGEKDVTTLRVVMGFAAFIAIGAVYKFALLRFGKILFGEAIR